MGPTQNKDLNKYLKTLIGNGWQIDCQGRHIKLYYPGSDGIVTVPKSPSDMRSIENVKAKVRRSIRSAFSFGEILCDSSYL